MPKTKKHKRPELDTDFIREASARLERIRPDPDSMWGCPCGWVSPFSKIGGHRRGWRSRPECQGNVFRLPEGTASNMPAENRPPPFIPKSEQARSEQAEPTRAALAQDEPSGYDSPEQAESAADSLFGPVEILGDEGILESERIARELNLQKAQADGLDIFAGIEGVDEPPPGDWQIDTPEGQRHEVSTTRESVSLPAIIRVWYDYFRSRGWFAGDGSMSAFCTDMLLHHFNGCFGLAVVVVSREDIGDPKWVVEAKALSAVDGGG